MNDDEVKAISGNTSAQQLRRARARRFLLQILFWVVVPTFLGIIYYGFLASSQYQSVSIVAVQSNVGGKNNSSKHDAMLVKEYALSRTMLDLLSTEHQFKELYQSHDNDIWARLGADASTEELYRYYLDKVHMHYESTSSTLRLTVRAFTPEAARDLNAAIIKASEDMSNAMYERAGSDRISFAEEQLAAAQARLGKARQALADLKVSVPESDGTATSERSSASIESELARLEPAIFERDLAQKSFDSARAALENTRVEVLQEKRYIVIISQPSLPTGSVHPRRLWGVVTVFVLSIVLMGVLTMLGAAVREHARF